MVRHALKQPLLRRFIPYRQITRPFDRTLSPRRHFNMSSANLTAISERISSLQEEIKQLKISKSDASAQVEEMKSLKASLAEAKKAAASAGDAQGENGGNGFVLKTPKGTVDHKPEAALLRRKIFSTLEGIFIKYGASTIDTPVFELKEILAGKYGEDQKLIYDLQDQGGELCSLRYDLTVPFARYLAMNGISSMKRYHIGKVYRRDQPVMSKGRMREFYQCDFDIAGPSDPMVPDAELLCLLCEALSALDIGPFTVKLNNRKILDGIFEFAGVPNEKTRSISSAVDKLDKTPWAEVKREMTEEKGLSPDVADKIGEYVGLKGPGFELLEKLEADKALSAVPSVKAGLEEMRKLFGYLEVLGCLDKMSFDMSLARGLDYYTGLIFEAITEGSAPPSKSVNPPVPPTSNISTDKPNGASSSRSKDKKTSPSDPDAPDEEAIGVGSIAGGGRYDNMVGNFAESAGLGNKDPVPCVGVSIGVERVYSIMEMRRRKGEEKPRGKETEVYIMNFGKEGLLKERMGLARLLRENGIKAEYMFKENPRDRAQFNVADSEQIPYVAILAPKELAAGTVRIKAQVGKDASGDSRGEEVKMTEVVQYLQQKLGRE